jgi:HEAT repeat protein/tetratricopeptide (TPR) repeat protein
LGINGGDFMRVFNLLRTRIEEMEDNADVEGLIHALNDDSENVRREAVLALERIGDVRATEPLIQKLQDPDKTIQEEAITALGRIQDKKAVPVLIQTLNNKFIGIRWRAAEALGKIGDPMATEPLIQKLQDPDQTIQEEAITALGRIQDKKAVPVLIQTLNYPNSSIRSRAIEALGKIGDPQATEPIIMTLHDKEKIIQEVAITALGRIAVDPLVQDLKSEDHKLKENAILSLNRLREFKVSEPEIKDDVEDVDSDEELIDRIVDEAVSKEKSDFNSKSMELESSGFYVYLENFVKNSRYNYLDGFNNRSRYDYEFVDIKKLRNLLENKGINFTEEEVTWLIQAEIENQEYLEFEAKITAQKPENLNQYIETMIKIYPEPRDHMGDLEKLLKNQNINHQNLEQEIKKTQKQMEITEFENKLLAKEAMDMDKKHSPTILKEFREKELEENKLQMINTGKYEYIEKFVEKSRSHYESGDIINFKILLAYRGMEFSDADLLWLIQKEIQNQEYLEFEAKITAQKPENLNQYIETMIKIYPEPQDHMDDLIKLLKQKNIKHQNLGQEIKKTQKQMEITEFENKLMAKSVEESILPFEMQDMDYAYTSFNLGNLYFDIAKTDKALSYYDKALYVYPDFVDAWKNMGLIYFTMGRFQKAAACYNQILLLDHDYPELWIAVGLLFFEIDRVPEAKLCYERAKELNPCYKTEDLAVETLNFLKNRPLSLEKLNNYLELASSADWETSDPTPPLSRIITLLNRGKK